MDIHFCERFKCLRSLAKLTQADVAERLGVTAQAVSKWECGRNLPDLCLLPEIADMFGVTIDKLFRD